MTAFFTAHRVRRRQATAQRVPFLVRRTPQLVLVASALVALDCAIEAARLVAGRGPALAFVGLAILVAGAISSRRLPTVGLAVIAVGAVVVGAAGWGTTVEYSVCAFAAFAVAVRSPVTWRVPLLLAPAIFLAEALGEDLRVGPVAFVAAFGVAAAAAVGISLRSQRQYWSALERSESDAVATREIEAQRRVAEERIRIARDLHDAMGHQVAVAAMRLGVAEVHLPPEADRSRAAIEEARSALKAVLAETQQVLGVLRRSDDTDALTPVPHLDRLDDLLASYRAIGLAVDWDEAPVPADVDDVTSMTAYRVLQEALTNAHRYGSGGAAVRIHAHDGELEVRVDNPRSALARTASGGGYGLVGMRERVEAAGGDLEIERAVDRFRIRAVLPMHRRSTA